MPERWQQIERLYHSALRLDGEARAASALNHPNIITIHEVGEADGSPYIVTEYIEGGPLRQQMESRRMTFEAAIDVAIKVASALAASHLDRLDASACAC